MPTPSRISLRVLVIVAGAGGADALTVTAEPAKQMGNSYVVVAAMQDGSVVHEFVLERLDRKYLLLPKADSLS